MAAQYLAGHDPADVAASPALAGPSRLAAACPSLFVQVGGDEVLLDDSVTVTRSAGVGGTRVRLEIWPEMQHFFQLGVGVYPEAQEALDVAGEWLARSLDVTRT